MKKRKNLLQLQHPDANRRASESNRHKENKRLLTEKRSHTALRWVFSVVFVLLINFGCSSNEIKSLPPEVLDEWKTTAAKFEDFSFELGNETITFMDLNADNEMEVYFILKRTRDLDEKKDIYYTVFYENDEGLEFQFAFYYDPSGDGKIRLKNQKTIVWTRVPEI